MLTFEHLKSQTLPWFLPMTLSVTMSSCQEIGSVKNPQTSQIRATSAINAKKLQKCIDTFTKAGVAIGHDHLLPNCTAAGLKRGQRCMVAIEDIRPTQAAIGFEQVELRRLKVRRQIQDGTLKAYLEATPEPIVIGPNRSLYIIDHHHLGTALMHEGVQRTYGVIVEDLSHLEIDDFWKTMQHCNWVYPKNENGEPISFSQLPSSLGELKDNPYRSLAGFVRKSDGYSKVPEPFIEFKWAEFFQKNLNISADEIQNNYEAATQAAFELARSEIAGQAGLPGYIQSPALKKTHSQAPQSQKDSLMSCEFASKTDGMK